MIHVQRRVHLDPPPAEVFAYLTDVERIPEWQAEAGIKRVTRSDSGPMGAGSQFRMERYAQGRTAGIDATMNLWEPTHRFAFDTIDDDKWDRIVERGSLEDRRYVAAFEHQGRILAVVTLGEDLLSLEIDAAMSAGDEAKVKALVTG